MTTLERASGYIKTAEIDGQIKEMKRKAGENKYQICGTLIEDVISKALQAIGSP